jgi:hypothetical protein
MSRRLVCSVSTVKDTPDNLRAFVRRNLAAGVDHMFVFIDGGDADLHATIAGLDHVTAVRAGRGYWGGYRPKGLNERQYINANVANLMLAGFDEVAWLFHIDGDECLDIDRDRLFAVDQVLPAVRLTTLEAVAKVEWRGEVDRFKYPLDRGDLCMLQMLGAISKPRNTHYFHGHTEGKVGVRPGLDHTLRIHTCVDHQGQQLPLHASPDDLRVLHYESYSGEEFVRKWTALVSLHGKPRRPPRKDRIAGAVTAILARQQLGEQRRRELLMQVFRDHIRDDHDLLDELGLLMAPDPARHRHRPQGFEPERLAQVQGLVRLFREADKGSLGWAQQGTHPAWLMRELRDSIRSTDRALADRLDAALVASPGPATQAP